VSVATVAYEAMRRIRQVARAAPDANRIVVRANAAVVAFLCEEESAAIDRLERETNRRVSVETVEGTDVTRLDVRAL
jgi:Ribonuclease G/E